MKSINNAYFEKEHLWKIPPFGMKVEMELKGLEALAQLQIYTNPVQNWFFLPIKSQQTENLPLQGKKLSNETQKK